MIIENFLERLITHWIPFVFGYIIIPFRYVYHFVIDRPFTFGILSIILLFVSIHFFLSDKLWDNIEKREWPLYIDVFFIIISIFLLAFAAIGLDIKY